MDRSDQLLACVGALLDLDNPSQLPTLLSRPLHDVIPYDFLVYNEIDTATGTILTVSNPLGIESRNAVFEEYSYQHPLIRYYQRTHDPNVLRLSDHIGRSSLQRLDLYQDFLHPLGIEAMIVCTLPAAPTVAIGFVLTRSRSDFSDEECALLSSLRPYIVRAYQAARRRREGNVILSSDHLQEIGLSRREGEVLLAVGDGASNEQIAQELGIAVRTVKKHLERVYDKLRVTSRTAALAAARRSSF